MRLWRVPYTKFGSGPGLERVARVAERLGIDLAGFGGRGAAIVGSNGKGSTAAMTAAVLGQCATPVGLFTSPHLFTLNERFRIGDEDISDDELALHWERVAAAAESVGVTAALGGFEFLFLIAADWFGARQCAHTVWEAGIGGRHDTARLIEAGRVALTSLDIEHTKLLGSTLEDIARDKIDAAPSGGKLFVSEACSSVREAIKAHCASRRVIPSFAQDSIVTELPLPGAHQRGNAALAVLLARDLHPELSETQIHAGLAATRWPGRLEVINDAPLTVIDVGHTPEAIRAALLGFGAMLGGRQAVLVCGASHDKDVAALAGALAPGFSTIVCAAARHKGAPAAAIAQHVVAANAGADIAIAESVTEARKIAREKAGPAGAIYVAGGLFLAAEYRAVEHGLDPALLAFF
jgi:dihydrofolate synthase/folylpolyglutamate synthase